MSIQVHKSNSRGSANHGWLKSHHSFSFANYYNPSMMGHGKLRVLNDDVVIGGEGFGTHSHRDMEIISIPLQGEMKHQDTMGNEFILGKGEIQVMSAGTGVAHSEFNNSDTEEVHFLQIWIEPREKAITPSYGQKDFRSERQKNKAQLIASPDAQKGSLKINQDAYLSLIDLDRDHTFDYINYNRSNGLYVFVIDGDIELSGHSLSKRDAIAIDSNEMIKISAKSESEILIMEIPMS